MARRGAAGSPSGESRAAIRGAATAMIQYRERADFRGRYVKDDQKNFLIFAVVAAAILFAWGPVMGWIFPQQPPAAVKVEDGKTAAPSPAATPAADGPPGGARPRPGARRDQGRARGDRHADAQGLAQPQGPAHRRPRAQQVRRDRPQEFAADPAALAGGREGQLFRRVRLAGVGRRRPDQGHAVAGERHAARARIADHADRGQRHRPALPRRGRGRRELHVHDPAVGGQWRRGAGERDALCPRQPRRALDRHRPMGRARRPDRGLQRRGRLYRLWHGRFGAADLPDHRRLGGLHRPLLADRARPRAGRQRPAPAGRQSPTSAIRRNISSLPR